MASTASATAEEEDKFLGEFVPVMLPKKRKAAVEPAAGCAGDGGAGGDGGVSGGDGGAGGG
jgi:hypothetical protein